LTWATPEVDGNRIIAVINIGRHKVYDFTVPGYHNYCAGGLVHHNTEGAGGYETALHLTGRYPDWWEGSVFDSSVKFWAAGKTNETTRDIVQAKLFGAVAFDGGRKTVDGTGLVPGDDIGAITWKQGVQDLIDTVKVRHASGEWSVLGLKSYQQGRGAFEGTEQDGIWLDEEPPIDIYGECLIRTATTDGLIYITFTPLDGMTPTAISFLPGGKVPK
jgi:phage terminase large subunit-like protein